jgi:hypothetical protein
MAQVAANRRVVEQAIGAGIAERDLSAIAEHPGGPGFPQRDSTGTFDTAVGDLRR